MKLFFFLLAAFFTLFFSGYSIWSNAAILLWIWYVLQLLYNSNKSLAFREFILVLYGLNYLLSPAMAYHQDQRLLGVYRMSLTESEYFSLAIPAMLCLQAGLFVMKTNIFRVNFVMINLQSVLNQSVLKSWLIIGVICSVIRNYLPGELSFFVYLVSGIRFIAAFGLFALDRKKYKWYLLGALILEIFQAIWMVMFHDLVLWIVFFAIFFAYLQKPSIFLKMSFLVVGIFAVFILQVSKNDYRQKTWFGTEDAGIGTFKEVALGSIEKGLFTERNFAGSFTRVNQAWIFASTVKNMDRRLDFQGLHIVGLYLESAILPRFIAPNKLSSGNKEIFNKFSGHTINKGTSMGLGVFGDGYIAYGTIGVYIFAFVLGLLFCIVFKIVETWVVISPFFVFFIFPILNYAVRPDCETQTIIGHLVKSVFVFAVMVSIYRKYFSVKIYLQRKRSLEEAVS